ncbi:UNVERIFIED_CONTAM: hypothetical protein H355_015649 [Colinus virginianus]|nr:hypothetical protein H355_015649 [Colinus virginianus]
MAAAVLCKEELRKILRSDRRNYYTVPALNEVLYLHQKGYKRLESLEEFTGLKALHAETNGEIGGKALPSLGGARHSGATHLQENCIRKIENLDQLTYLQCLNLSDNFIEKLENLSTNSELKTLLLQRNHIGANGIQDLEHLVLLKSLTVLDLSHNKIDCAELVTDVLPQLPELRVLYLHGNPVVRKIPNYRKTVINTLKALRYLDDRPVFHEDRRCAEAFARGGLTEERNELKKLREEKEEINLRNRTELLVDFSEAAVAFGHYDKATVVMEVSVPFPVLMQHCEALALAVYNASVVFISIARPILRPGWKRYLVDAFEGFLAKVHAEYVFVVVSQASEALEAIQSPLTTLRAHILYQVAACEAEDYFPGAAKESLVKLLAVDYSVVEDYPREDISSAESPDGVGRFQEQQSTMRLRPLDFFIKHLYETIRPQIIPSDRFETLDQMQLLVDRIKNDLSLPNYISRIETLAGEALSEIARQLCLKQSDAKSATPEMPALRYDNSQGATKRLMRMLAQVGQEAFQHGLFSVAIKCCTAVLQLVGNRESEIEEGLRALGSANTGSGVHSFTNRNFDALHVPFKVYVEVEDIPTGLAITNCCYRLAACCEQLLKSEYKELPGVDASEKAVPQQTTAVSPRLSDVAGQAPGVEETRVAEENKPLKLKKAIVQLTLVGTRLSRAGYTDVVACLFDRGMRWSPVRGNPEQSATVEDEKYRTSTAQPAATQLPKNKQGKHPPSTVSSTAPTIKIEVPVDLSGNEIQALVLMEIQKGLINCQMRSLKGHRIKLRMTQFPTGNLKHAVAKYVVACLLCNHEEVCALTHHEQHETGTYLSIFNQIRRRDGRRTLNLLRAFNVPEKAPNCGTPLRQATMEESADTYVPSWAEVESKRRIRQVESACVAFVKCCDMERLLLVLGLEPWAVVVLRHREQLLRSLAVHMSSPAERDYLRLLHLLIDLRLARALHNSGVSPDFCNALASEEADIFLEPAHDCPPVPSLAQQTREAAAAVPCARRLSKDVTLKKRAPEEIHVSQVGGAGVSGVMQRFMQSSLPALLIDVAEECHLLGENNTALQYLSAATKCLNGRKESMPACAFLRCQKISASMKLAEGDKDGALSLIEDVLTQCGPIESGAVSTVVEMAEILQVRDFHDN